MHASGDFDCLIAAAVRDMAAAVSTAETLQLAVGLASSIVDGCDMAGISLVRKTQWIDTPHASHESMRLIDEEQFTLGEGPCIDALRDLETVSSADLANDSRWPAWGPKVVAEAGVRSCVCVRLFISGASLGALSLYSRTLRGFTPLDIDHGVALAAQIALAFQASESQRSFDAGLANRAVIGQAVGMVMERYTLDPDTAFKVLARLSSQLNIKLVETARALVVTGDLPTARSRDASTP